MIITYLKLENYKRFPLSNVEVFEKEFKYKMTVITGPNGSGKSSLISELTPLPTSKDNFFENGYKEIHIEHKDQQYRLVCDFRGTSKFYFYLNDQNLNLSHNVTMQKDLAYQHFGITPVIHELLTGKETFTEMSLVNRKKLIHAITHLNIDSIIENYEKLKEELKNFDFLQKNLSNQLVMEKHKLADKEATVRLQQQLGMFHQHIDHMLTVRQELYRYAHGADLTVTSEALRRLEDQRQRTFNRNYVYLTSYSRHSVQGRLTGLQANISHLDASLKLLYGKLEKLEEEKKTFSLTNSKNVEDLVVENNRIETGIQRRIDGLMIFKDPETKAEETLSALQILESGLPDVLERLPANPERQFSKSRYNELLEAKTKLLSLLNVNLQKLSRTQAELKELQNHKELNCPNCNHSWLPDEIDSRLSSLTKTVREMETEQANYQFAIQGLDKDLAIQAEYLTQLSLFNNLYSSTKTVLGPLWNQVSEQSLLYNQPQQMLTVVRKASQDCLALISIKDLDKKKKENETLIRRISELTHNSQKSIDDEIRITEEKIYDLQTQQDEVKEKLRDVQYTKSIYDALSDLDKAIRLASSDLQDSAMTHVVNNIITEIDTQLSLSKVTLLEIEREISKQNMIEANVARLDAQLEEVNEHVKVLTILTDELSPKNGYIAKTISNYLNVIINRLNSIIAGVWDYKMIIKPIDIGEDALNYKFKVEVEDKLPIPDINVVSKGMQEMINLAMKITLYKLLGLESYPIYLDEYGDKLDKHHRAKISDIVFRMIGSPVYSQIFLISHIDMSYAQFKDTEVLEM